MWRSITAHKNAARCSISSMAMTGEGFSGSNAHPHSSTLSAHAAATVEAAASHDSGLPSITLPILPPSWRLTCDGHGDGVCQQAYSVLAWVSKRCVPCVPLVFCDSIRPSRADQKISVVTHRQVRLRSFIHSAACVQDDGTAAAAVADAAACGMFSTACAAPLQHISVSSQSPSLPSSAAPAPQSSEHLLLRPTSVSAVHALAIFCIVASQVMRECYMFWS